MAELTPGALRLAGRQHGAIARSQLAAHRVSPHTIRRLVGNGSLIRSTKSVCRLASAPRTLEQRCAELCLAHPAVYVTGPTAGVLAGLRSMPRRSAITLASPHPLHLDLNGVRFTRTTKIASCDVLDRHDGIRVAHPTRLAFDLAATLADRPHRSVLDQLLHEHGVTVDELRQIAARLCHPGRRGSARFLSSLMAVTDSPTESDAEHRVADALRASGVPIETNRQWLELPNGRRARLDLSVPSIRWGVEIDVHPSHLGLIGSTDDKRRDRQAGLIGWQIHRVTGLDLVDLEQTVDELVALYFLRQREFAA